jgi:hypothetical protein
MNHVRDTQDDLVLLVVLIYPSWLDELFRSNQSSKIGGLCSITPQSK